MARIGANLADVSDDEMNQDRSWTVLPDGWYRMIGKENVYKPTNAGDGMCLHLTHVFLDGPRQSKEHRDFLTLENPSLDTVRIAKTRLKELARAVGHPTPNRIEDADELMGKPFMARIYSEKSKDPKYGDKNGMQNRIGEYKTCEANGASVDQPAPQASNDAQPSDLPF